MVLGGIYTRAEGLPSDQAQALAFAADGTLYVGTQCDGIAIASPKDDYATWRIVRAPNFKSQISDSKSFSDMPTDPSGEGLPTNLINDLLVAKDGTVYAATTLGLAASTDQGQTWRYWRGRDYAAKVRGLYGGPPKGWEERPGAWLAEDYITCLAADAQGRLWVGYRRWACEAVDVNLRKRLLAGGSFDDYVMALLPLPDGAILVGMYGDGVRRFASGEGNPQIASMPSQNRNAQIGNGALMFPAGASVLTDTDFATMLSALSATANVEAASQPAVISLADDWSTQGDWLGRYGKYWACLAAFLSPCDYIWGAGERSIDYSICVGPNVNSGDKVRYWVDLLYSRDKRSLEMPFPLVHRDVVQGLTSWSIRRRQSEWDDHGETYPLALDGPNLRCSVDIPAGDFVFSVYDTNKDGHDGLNRLRDYLLTLHLADGRRTPDECRMRLRDFWHGVYKRWLVHGPCRVELEIERRHSVNTICAGLMLDRVDPWEEGHLVANARHQHNEVGDVGFVAYGVTNNPWNLMRRRDRATLLCRRLAGKEGDANRKTLELAQAYYAICAFEKWEEIVRVVSMSPRQIEQSLRWGGVTRWDYGRGHEMVTTFRRESGSINLEVSR